MLLSQKRILLSLLLCCCISFAQKKIEIKYFENNTKLPSEDARIFLVTKSDTVNLKVVKGKIRLAKNMKENFTLLTQINNKFLKIGSYRVTAFEEIDVIIVGRITDFSLLKKSWEFVDTFAIDTNNLITIPNSHTIKDVIYSIVRKDVDMSLNTDVTDYIPIFTSTIEIIERKNQ